MRLIVIATLMLWAFFANAAPVTIDFEEFYGEVGTFSPVTPVETQGYTISGSSTPLTFWYANDPFEGDVSVTLSNQGSFTISAVGGGSFNLLSFNYSFSDSAVGVLNLSAVTDEGATINFSPDLGAPVATSDPLMSVYNSPGGLNNIVSLTISNSGAQQYLALDKIVVSAVPIPAAVWLFGSALAGLGFLRRRVVAP